MIICYNRRYRFVSVSLFVRSVRIPRQLISTLSIQISWTDPLIGVSVDILSGVPRIREKRLKKGRLFPLEIGIVPTSSPRGYLNIMQKSRHIN